MTRLPKLLVAAFLLIAGNASSATRARADISIDFSRYEAVAYSPTTGKYGYAYDYGSRAAAERAALGHCKAADAGIVGWVKAGWIVLAVADDNAFGIGYCHGNGANSVTAHVDALNDCRIQTKSIKPPKIKLIVCSGDVAPIVNGD